MRETNRHTRFQSTPPWAEEAVEIDAGLFDLVTDLWELGYVTKGSCQGSDGHSASASIRFECLHERGSTAEEEARWFAQTVGEGLVFVTPGSGDATWYPGTTPTIRLRIREELIRRRQMLTIRSIARELLDLDDRDVFNWETVTSNRDATAQTLLGTTIWIQSMSDPNRPVETRFIELVNRDGEPLVHRHQRGEVWFDPCMTSLLLERLVAAQDRADAEKGRLAV